MSKEWLLVAAMHPVLKNQCKASVVLPAICIASTLCSSVVHILIERAVLSAGDTAVNITVKFFVVKELTFYSLGWNNSTSFGSGVFPWADGSPAERFA